LFSQTESRGQQHASVSFHATLELQNVKTRFPIRRSITDIIAGTPKKFVQAVNDVSLIVQPGSTLAIVGESGSGKTTLARSVLGLTPVSEGEMLLGNRELPRALSKRSRAQLKEIQAVAQNPDQALNPHLSIGISLRRQMVRLSASSPTEIQEAIGNLLVQVGLTEDYAPRLPSQLSGGEKQRVAIARAIAADSGLVVCDEATSSLDVSVQARILNLLARLQSEAGRAYLLISHDLAVVAHLADQIAVMYLGQLMEIGTRDCVLAPPYHPYTEALLSSYPSLDGNTQRKPIRLSGEVPSPVDLPTGCPFHSRCPRFIGPVCRDLAPPWQVSQNGHSIACHIPRAELTALQAHQIGESKSARKDGA